MKAPKVCLAAYIDGRWHEESYQTNDPQWREALKILKEVTPQVRILYSSNSNQDE
jgi:hypothetical protein